MAFCYTKRHLSYIIRNPNITAMYNIFYSLQLKWCFVLQKSNKTLTSASFWGRSRNWKTNKISLIYVNNGTKKCGNLFTSCILNFTHFKNFSSIHIEFWVRYFNMETIQYKIKVRPRWFIYFMLHVLISEFDCLII